VAILTLQEPKKEIYSRLTKQCESMDIPIIKTEKEFLELYKTTNVVMDAIFGGSSSECIVPHRQANGILPLSSLGFSFHPPVRPPYNRILDHIAKTTVPVLSIDIPSGWDVNDGKQPLVDTEGKPVETFEPDALLSLTAPKLGVKQIRGPHYLGGRFIPQ